MNSEYKNKLEVIVEELLALNLEVLNSSRWKFGSNTIDLIRAFLLKKKENGIIERFHELNKRHSELITTIQEKEKPIIIDRQKQPKVIFDKTKSVDVIIPVYNALEDVKKCIESVLSAGGINRLIIVNDFSEDPTTTYLNELAPTNHLIHLINNPENLGFTTTINKGLKASNADYQILLNSDTIVPSTWVEQLVAFGEKNQDVGVFGPLSNAASFQNVPELLEDGDFAINRLPTTVDVEEWNRILYANSSFLEPEVRFINGFCYIIKKEVIDKIGLFDVESFPKGYGEEDDYSLRAFKAGFKLAIMDDLYIFHAKSKSFGHKKRLELSDLGGKNLRLKHGDELIDSSFQVNMKNESLKIIRRKVGIIFNYLDN